MFSSPAAMVGSPVPRSLDDPEPEMGNQRDANLQKFLTGTAAPAKRTGRKPSQPLTGALESSGVYEPPAPMPAAAPSRTKSSRGRLTAVSAIAQLAALCPVEHCSQMIVCLECHTLDTFLRNWACLTCS